MHNFPYLYDTSRVHIFSFYWSSSIQGEKEVLRQNDDLLNFFYNENSKNKLLYTGPGKTARISLNIRGGQSNLKE